MKTTIFLLSFFASILLFMGCDESTIDPADHSELMSLLTSNLWLYDTAEESNAKAMILRFDSDGNLAYYDGTGKNYAYGKWEFNDEKTRIQNPENPLEDYLVIVELTKTKLVLRSEENSKSTVLTYKAKYVQQPILNTLAFTGNVISNVGAFDKDNYVPVAIWLPENSNTYYIWGIGQFNSGSSYSIDFGVPPIDARLSDASNNNLGLAMIVVIPKEIAKIGAIAENLVSESIIGGLEKKMVLYIDNVTQFDSAFFINLLDYTKGFHMVENWREFDGTNFLTPVPKQGYNIIVSDNPNDYTPNFE